MSWTDERVELLKKMWNEGQSASQIAKELGGVTRNAVIGKVHRLGLSNRNQAGEVEAPVLEPSAPVEPVVAEPAEPAPRAEPVEAAPAVETDDADDEDEQDAPIPARRQIVPAGQPLPPQPSANEISAEALETVREVEKSSKRLTLMELTERTCKWPIGDPASENFWFCGLPVQSGKPYCEAHVGVAFQPMSSRRDRRR
ncbi:GcrA cell cycle regulator [Palleronia marisminoris]|uniref:GcrA cell cycle regulator n=1 Tax=Palleronia marisminoris TaxID=315423 RepID=A0A1Y5RTS6_9RHOB|nr:GcrA family cell cycle regulator [Palleronia marisminoris]SFG49544.1 GcrA cell cycle regulator [Palleronia marisminoris]SLN25037.1 GcrA cell cycle regulator [Palleronia marisminoris]